MEKNFENLTPAGKLILGIARTGAKFTPLNHKPTGDPVLDKISSGAMIPCDVEDIRLELAELYSQGVRYFHEHARNPSSKEQTVDLKIYDIVSRLTQAVAPDAMLSFGGSRNGREIAAAIKANGEHVRVAHAGRAYGNGGAHFVTTQAAIELQVALDLEKQGFIRMHPEKASFDVLRSLDTYEPSGTVEEAKLAVNSTAGGANYGSSSARVQYETLKWTIEARKRLALPYEVEWVQEARSAFLTWYLANHMKVGLRTVGRLNITLLFGFSPRLPFPETYEEFKRLVAKAHQIANPMPGGDKRSLHVSVSVGAAVLPQHAAHQLKPVDVGPLKGKRYGPMERLAIYAAQPDSDVDILRVGLEDTPYLLGRDGDLIPASNVDLVKRAKSLLEIHGVELITDTETLEAFRKLPERKKAKREWLKAEKGSDHFGSGKCEANT